MTESNISVPAEIPPEKIQIAIIHHAIVCDFGDGRDRCIGEAGHSA
jgi:hypothetical protein